VSDCRKLCVIITLPIVVMEGDGDDGIAILTITVVVRELLPVLWWHWWRWCCYALLWWNYVVLRWRALWCHCCSWKWCYCWRKILRWCDVFWCRGSVVAVGEGVGIWKSVFWWVLWWWHCILYYDDEGTEVILFLMMPLGCWYCSVIRWCSMIPVVLIRCRWKQMTIITVLAVLKLPCIVDAERCSDGNCWR